MSEKVVRPIGASMGSVFDWFGWALDTLDQTDRYLATIDREDRVYSDTHVLGKAQARAVWRKLAELEDQARRNTQRVACHWKQGGWDEAGMYSTDCGHDFVLNNDSTPEENTFRFCAYCGNPLVSVPHVEPVDDEESATNPTDRSDTA